ncbi:MAG: hypothetical protein JWR85_506 [Marmoricola sp.]|nr:hypothetical protein [Marmoricola sp.]
MSDLILIPVPGTSNGAPVVRVVVAPRLDAAQTIAAAGMDNWPAILTGATFRLEFAAGQSDPVHAVHEGSTEVWNSFFSALRVDASGTPDIGEPPTVTRTADQVDAILGTYTTTAAVPVDPESGAQPNLGKTAAQELRTRWSGPAPPPPQAGSVAATGAVDFHRVLTLLREHPAVLRRLGLVFDVPVVNASALGTEGTVRVRWVDPPAGVPAPQSPRAAYEVHSQRGLVPARSSTTRAGLVDLRDTDAWSTTTIDVDTAVDRLRDAASSVGPVSAPADEAVRLPVLRSAGIALLRRGRATEFDDRRKAAAANAALPSIEDAEPLRADQLALGLRLDVRLSTATRWTSLMRRNAKYTVDGVEILPPAEEEGHVKSGAAVVQADATLRADEVVARWTGWSLAAPRPTVRRDTERRVQLPFEFDWEFEVPDGSLLSLRFGNDYHLRARVLDLAGGGLPRGEPDLNSGTPAVPYLRHQPVSPPMVTVPATATVLGPGGSPDVLVIRADAPDYPVNDERSITAPLTSLDVAEGHGVLDGRDATTHERVRQAMTAGLPDPASAGVMVFVDPAPGGTNPHATPWPWSEDWPGRPEKTIRLVPRPAGEDEWVDLADADTALVRLAPSEQVTVALSSFLPGNFADHFALHQWHTIGATAQVVQHGRHPMATPPHELTLVHAVRKPINQPAGAFTVQQVEGGVSAVLVPQPVMLTIHARSTVQLQVAASWTEVSDEQDDVRVRVSVQNFHIEAGDTELGAPLVHQLGDTRHRLVTYTLTAVSRFRHLYRSDEDEARFVNEGTVAGVSIKSTVRPVPPAVRAVVPAFRWTRSSEGGVVRRVRSGGTLRVELLRPWRVTGEGEQLAVVVDRSESARDPIWSPSGVERALGADDFASASEVSTTALPGATVAAYDVKFAEDRWVADIELPGVAAASYRPFVRLAVARYQRESLPGLSISDVVLTDLVQLMPERTLTVETSSLNVRLDGVGPVGPHPNRVDVIVESRASDGTSDVAVLAPGTGLDAWTPVATTPTVLGLTVQVARPASGASTFRIRVREVEVLSDFDVSRAGTADELEERVVFTDVVELS